MHGHQLITEVPPETLVQCVWQTPVHLPSVDVVFKCWCLSLTWPTWFKTICVHSLLPFSPHLQEKPKSSIKETTWDVPAFVGCLTNRIAQEQHKKQCHVYALSENNTTAVIILTILSATTYKIQNPQYQKCSRVPTVSFHSWIHLYYYVHTLLSATRSYMLRKSISLMLFYWTGF